MMAKYFSIINILLITALIYFGVKASYGRMASEMEIPFTNAVTANQQKQVSPDEVKNPLTYYNPIAERNLFKTKDKDEAKQDEIKEDVPEPEETKLNLKLWGTVSGDGRKTYAVIEDMKEKKQNLYREGDRVQNADVKKILRGQVVLNVNGKDEMLNMEEKMSGSSGKEMGKASPPEAPEMRAQEAMPPEGERPEMRLAEGSPQSITLPRSEVETAIQDINALMSQAKIRPHFKDGKPDGLTFSRVKPNSIFSKLGLRGGDVLIGIDGAPIESADDALKLYESLKSSPKVGVQIRRRGQLQNIDYNIE